jgi:hypothetical protein
MLACIPHGVKELDRQGDKKLYLVQVSIRYPYSRLLILNIVSYNYILHATVNKYHLHVILLLWISFEIWIRGPLFFLWCVNFLGYCAPLCTWQFTSLS